MAAPKINPKAQGAQVIQFRGSQPVHQSRSSKAARPVDQGKARGALKFDISFNAGPLRAIPRAIANAGLDPQQRDFVGSIDALGSLEEREGPFNSLNPLMRGVS